MKTKILMVDDEPEIINAYRRLFFSFKNVWEINFATSGAEAIEFLKNNEVDVVVSDMRMPGMNGDELLRIIQSDFPGTLRIILSGYQDEISIIRSLSSAHQFLIKPCEPDKLKVTIENAYALRDLIENKQFIEFANGLDELPVLPQIYIKLEREFSKEDISLRRVADIIEEDPVISAKILQVVNSGFFGIPRRIADLMEALNYLGTNLVKAIILYVETFSVKNYPEAESVEIRKIGKHSMKTAEIGRVLCKLKKLDKKSSDNIIISCILHDIGRLLMIRKKNYLNDVLEKMASDNISMIDAENKLYGFTHTSAGAYLLGIWGLPKEIIEAVGFHHNPSAINCEADCVTGVVHFANAFANYSKSIFNFKEFDLDLEYTQKFISEDEILKLWKNVLYSLDNK
ncbi:response regulator [Candidatus Kapaibacterium sp.]